MRVPFRQGLVKAGPSLLTFSGSFVTLNVVDTPLLVTIAAGSKDYLWVEPQTVSNAWGPILSIDTWLYLDINTRNAMRTFGTTTIAPTTSGTAPSSPATGTHWYDTTTDQLKVWSGTAWQVKSRVFIAKLANGSVIQSLSINAPSLLGTQVGDTSEIFAGHILFDLDDQPIKQSNGKFMTTEDRLRSRVLSTAELKIASMQLEAEAGENLAKYSIVVFSDFGVIQHASLLSPSLTGQFGIIETDALTGDLATVVTSGLVENPDWDWTSVGVNQPVYCTTSGSLSAVEQIAGQVPVGVIVDRHTIKLATPQVSSGSGAASVPVATTSDFGKVRLNIAPTSASDPIVVGANDTRLTNARTPTAHTHATSDVTGLTAAITGELSNYVIGPASSLADELVRFNGTTGKVIKGGLVITTSTTLAGNSNTNIPTEAAVKAYVDSKPTGSGDVVGPASSVADDLVRFNGTTGKLVKGGLSVTTSTTLSGNSNLAIPTEAAVKAYVDASGGSPDSVLGPASATNNAIPLFDGTTGKLVKDSATVITTSTTLGGNSNFAIPTEAAVKAYVDANPGVSAYDIPLAVSDETTAITAGTAKVTFRAPRAFTLSSIRANLTTAQTSGALITINVKINGTSAFSTKITIDNGEKTSTTAAAPAVMTSSTIVVPDDAEIVVDVDQIGDGTAKGLKLTLVGIDVGTVNMREMLTAPRTYYVRTDGNNNNSGLTNTAGGAFLTIQRAIDVACSLDMSIYQVTISVGPGTYTNNITAKNYLGALRPIILGDAATPANVVISTTGATCVNVAGVPQAWEINGFRLQTTTDGNCITVSSGSNLFGSNLDFGPCVGNHISVSTNANCTITSNYTISGSAAAHMVASSGATLTANNKTITLTGTPAFGTFAVCAQGGGMFVHANTYSDSATGVRYSVTTNAVLYTETASSTYFPGSSAGSSATGGQYG